VKSRYTCWICELTANFHPIPATLPTVDTTVVTVSDGGIGVPAGTYTVMVLFKAHIPVEPDVLNVERGMSYSVTSNYLPARNYFQTANFMYVDRLHSLTVAGGPAPPPLHMWSECN
jgi:hypothetical protein